MTLEHIMYIIVWAWCLSEIVLSLKTRVKRGESKAQDKYSLEVVAYTIYICVGFAVYAGIHDWGDIPFYHYSIKISGLLLIITGIIFRWIAIFTLRKYFSVHVRIREDHRVIQHGIYRYIRHPSYTGSLISFLGLGLFFHSWLCILVLTVPLFCAYLYRIHCEEKALIQALGEDYIEYAKSTKRLIPGIY